MPLPDQTHVIDRPSIRDEVYGRILDWIMAGILKPGEKIVDKDLAAHLGVSRTPVREALRRLEDKDLVESSANRWTKISEIPSKEPEMIYPIIWTLEKLALSTGIESMTRQDFERMVQANRAFGKALENKDPVAASKADTAFHDVFIQRSQNILLIRILDDLKIRYRRFEVAFFNGFTRAGASVQEHEALIDALKNKNLRQAETILHNNWEKSLHHLKTTGNNCITGCSPSQPVQDQLEK